MIHAMKQRHWSVYYLSVMAMLSTATLGQAAMNLDPVPVNSAPASAPAAEAAPQTNSGGGLGAQGGSSPSLGVSSWITRGRTRLSVGAGWASTSNGSYALLSGGVGYFLMQGLEAGLDGEAWVGNTPQIYKVTPGLRYVFPLVQRFFPYVGAFYRRVLYTDEEPLNSVGGRVGAYLPIGNRVYAGGGAVFEQQLDCDTRVYKYCNEVYPEFSLLFSF